jgi:DNA-binding MarR family transcriptional regulator
MTRAEAISIIRSFNRFYTRLLGVLDRHFLESPHSLTEVRVLFEVYHRRGISAREVKDFLQIDEGYCSRLLDGLATQGLIRRTRSAQDGRRYTLTLTARGRRLFLDLNRRSTNAIATLISDLSETETRQLVSSLQTAQALLERGRES